MELHSMIFSRMKNDEQIEELTACFDDRAAVFYQRAASSEDEKWGSSIQYPRIDYTLDMLENPARHTSGLLVINVWCDILAGAEPEEIEIRLRELFHSAFAQTDDCIYSFAWQRSDPFEVKNQVDQTPRIIGTTVVFDVVACPCQCTTHPDPIKGLNDWTKEILPNAIVIGKDEVTGWLMPTRETPVIYWRITSQGIARQYYAYTRLSISFEGHVYCMNAADRLYNLVKINTAYALSRHIPLEDTSPLFLKTFDAQPHMNYILTGQIRASGEYAILQPPSNLARKAEKDKETGQTYKLNHANQSIERRISHG